MVDRRHPLVDLLHRALDIVVKQRAEFRQPDVSAVLFKQVGPQLVFQIADGLGKRGLGDVQCVGGAGIMLHFRHGLEVDQRLEIHRAHLTFS